MGGAKNHMLILPDADLEDVANALMGAAYGSAGERCMAISVGVSVSVTKSLIKLIDILKPRVEALAYRSEPRHRSRNGTVGNTKSIARKVMNLHPDGRRMRVHAWSSTGATFVCEGNENGYFPRWLTDRQCQTSAMQSYQEEIFGPVLQIMRVGSFEEGAALATDHPYGNGTSIFTQKRRRRPYLCRQGGSRHGRHQRADSGSARFPQLRWLEGSSAFGDHNQYGMEGLRFYTKVKTVTARWADKGLDAEFTMPVLK